MYVLGIHTFLLMTLVSFARFASKTKKHVSEIVSSIPFDRPISGYEPTYRSKGVFSYLMMIKVQHILDEMLSIISLFLFLHESKQIDILFRIRENSFMIK